MKHSRSRLSARATAAVALLFGCEIANAGPFDPPAFDEAWYVVTLQGAKCGYLHTITRRVEEEVHTRSLMKVKVSRGGSPLEIEMEQSYRESIDGAPLAFKQMTRMGTMPISMSGTIENGRVTLVTEQLGTRREAVYDFDPEIKLVWGQLLAQRRHGLKPGTTYAIKTYEPSLKVDAPIEMTFKVHRTERVDVLGEERALTKMTGTLRLATPIVTEMWVDSEVNPVVVTVDMGFVKLKMFQATKEKALGDDEPPELFLTTLIAVKRKIGQEAQQMTLRLRLPPEGGLKLPNLPDTSMQKVRRLSDHEAIVTVRRLDWDELRKVRDADSVDPAMADYLRASTTLDTSDRKIQRLARKAAKGCKTPAERADALRRFVTNYVKDKSLDIAFATASEVARSREGDCTEHGVLLAALARAAGLPARGVSGIVEVPSGPLSPARGSAFGYHMWAQVNIGGRWVDIDAAMRQTNCDPTHVALALTPLNEEGWLESTLSLLPQLGRLEIEVIHVEK